MRIIRFLDKAKFKDFDAKKFLMLYEYVSHIETKVKITPEEKEILVLSGRLAIYLKTNELKELLLENIRK